MSTPRPRFALCLSGQPRTWPHCVDSLFRFFSNADVDVYLHTWDEIGTEEQKDLKTRYQPVWIQVEHRPDFTPQKQAMARRFPINPQFFAYDMAYSFCTSLQAALSSGQAYDHYVRVRFDSLFDGVMPQNAGAAGSVWVFDAGNSFRFSDLYAHGSRDVMTVYAGFYDWLCTALDAYDQPRFVVEYALAKYLRNRHVPMAYMPATQMKLLRPEMAGRAFADVRRDIMFEIEKTRTQIRDATQDPYIGQRQQVDISSPYYKDADTIHKALSTFETLDGAIKNKLEDGAWSERLVICEHLIEALFPELILGSAALETTRAARMAITLFLNRMTSYPPLDPAGMVLTLLSFEGDDHALSHQWAAEHADETAQLLANKTLHLNAPYLMGALTLHAQIASRGAPNIQALLALSTPATTTV